MNRGGRLNPLKVLPFLVVASGALLVIIWLLDSQNPMLDLSLFLSVALGAFTAFLGSSMALWIYSYLTREGQRRQWAHDLEVRHFEEIYGPLYEETRKLIRALKSYEQPHLAKWREIRESSFAPFVEGNIGQYLVLLERELNDLREVAHRSWESADTCLKEAVKESIGVFPLNDIPNASSQLKNALRGDQRFLFAPDVDRPEKRVIEGIRGTMGLASIPNDDEIIYQFCRLVKVRLAEDPAIKERVAKTDLILPMAESIHKVIAYRMRDPFWQE